MRPLFGYIPRPYAPLRTLTRQSFGSCTPALTATHAGTATTRFNSRMSTSSVSQSMSTKEKRGDTITAFNGAATATASTKEDHRGHHPTESTSPAPENATSTGPADDTTTTTTTNSSSADSSQPHTQQPPLALPPLPEPSGGNSAAGDDANKTVRLDLGGAQGGSASTSLDHLGPLVVNQDGTMSRIGNWGEMSEIERQNTLRILGRRNQIRLAALREADAAGRREE
ncbi:hypothetical protein CCHL11_01634 [Colletotrichum chlorophyti]|uniref:Uncharacterized protein n=1 Tax=Colletotrichum chlorophyti TaxID=708187 RepID=A0A1Q8RY71_9PEZI|nr:hypothetical protein CCHL11_01634 [Colletotrichum chlorophyti]